MLKNDILDKVICRNDGEFSVEELFSPQIWAAYPIEERRGAGRWTFNQVGRGLFNVGGSVVEPLPNSNPQRYRKRKETAVSSTGRRIFLNEIPDIEQPCFRDLVKILAACGLWLEIVDKPQSYTGSCKLQGGIL